MRRLTFSALSFGFAAILAGAATAETPCEGRPVESDARDKCLASYIEIETPDRGWQRVNEGAKMCFRAEEDFWRWQCTGFEESSRCRSGGSGREVRVSLNQGEVLWECLASQ